MHRWLVSIALLVSVFCGVLHAQAPFTIRAASAELVDGWERMPSPNGNGFIWVSPSAGLTAADIQRAQRIAGTDGRTSVGIVFTSDGARKMRELSRAQVNKLVALILDGKVIWAPVVRDEIGSEAVLTGNGPAGVAPAVVERILALVKSQ